MSEIKKWKYTFETDKNFEKGNCIDCPLSYDEEYEEDDGFNDMNTYCVLFANFENCPLQEECEVTKIQKKDDRK